MSPDDDRPAGAPPPWQSGGADDPPPTPPPAAPPPGSTGPAPPPPGGPRHPSGAGHWSETPPAARPAGPAATGGWGGGGWGAPAWGTPGQPSPWTPTPPRRRRWRWLAVVLGLVWAAIIGLAIFLGVFAFRVYAPMNATGDVLDDLEQRDYRDAYAATCSAEQNRFTEPQYAAVMRSLTRRHGTIEDTGVTGARLHGSEASVSYWIRFERSGRKEYTTLVVKESGDWRPCLLSENPHA